VWNNCIHLSAALIEQFDLQKGDIVCFYTPNNSSTAIAILSVWCAGAIYTSCGVNFSESMILNYL
jgi:acyl-coenzyme A synthetase/AMP-(fatty) acid ligase